MRKSMCGSLLLVGACLSIATGAWAQQNPGVKKPSTISTDLAVTYTTEYGKLATAGNSFWLQGASADGAVTLWNGFGIAANLDSGSGNNLAPGINLNQIQFAAGPRYTWTEKNDHASTGGRYRLQVFGQGLFGVDHAFNGVFPTPAGVVPTATSLAIDAGGGLNLSLNKTFGVRMLEADYIRTSLPNNASNTQNDMRLSFGVTYHIGKH